MRYIIALMLAFLPGAGWAEDWEDQLIFNEGAEGPRLRVISSTDTVLFAPLIEEFVAKNPLISVEYLVSGTADINMRVRAAADAFDVVVSSAMDLQLKLANDGYALPIDDIDTPHWAQWHNSLFSFTTEPAAIVINRAAFEGQQVPVTRQMLIEALRKRPEEFRGKVGTYDVRQSGLGYLFATQDARASETYWRLMEVMGGLDVRLYCCSGEMINDLADGTILVAYNVLGSYAAVRAEGKDALEVIFPTDFQTIMMRTALVSNATQEPDAAEAFIRHLVAEKSAVQETQSSLPPLTSPGGVTDRETIGLNPALLTFLDDLKRKKFLSAWENAVIQ
ncbi:MULTISPECIES: ABC transporter substrate-binding protein [unclassified Ruegeria]|uniref:ABC transporter substrate-binding protein n=1 Tax=unclassified Ruegeria TaxID=2625375 RepID=UPI001ADC371D|nr:MULTISPECIES: ABC transporter substrate-binding protein [unclassified Ruegeria]MBO9412266.1 ABC transporter substrate-binding protein [Ruegeria sp. R8_1]MBO9417428.1 ABC transporter substrate-binding protein [Ruegeria sp. R8_2]